MDQAQRTFFLHRFGFADNYCFAAWVARIFNRRWLLRLGSAVDQDDPDYADQWIFDLLNSGWFAEAAMQGFVEVEKQGTYNIRKIISKNE